MSKKHIFFYKLVRPLVIAYLWLKFGYTFKVAKDLPDTYIVLSNHTTDYDPLFLAASFPGRCISSAASTSPAGKACICS